MVGSDIELSYRVPDDMQSQVIISIVLGFATDPAMRWCWPDNDVYINTMPKWTMASGGKAFAAGTALYHNGCGALWLPPGVTPDEPMMESLITETINPDLHDTLALLGEKLTPYQPHRQHWYLPLIGAESTARGQGAGTALMESVTRVCDEQMQLAYLMCSNPMNVGFYQRQGFEVMDEVRVKDFPLMIPMVRLPKKRHR
ncbi:GNAT family N-acetyltransferase [Photobacterium aphoticum]|uniref:N-acetyltransferase domain-containing protein n=1 Tax=Photobacterium aphoticum TaxID=754436 RepID=A0A0J1GL28_9GAMM|nr:GNAT family N-acetyltransferase [Photobacterium aphoticum]KLV00408.1 hypothetical protein ABT58_12110 [Photobacterium aphoticum]PSU59749.1 N-acetyltransferase [Photobacterium aphoticum]GHA42654.1 hypothetical protein GCM10007086_15360 [Photobacterium aphoticum]